MITRGALVAIVLGLAATILGDLARGKEAVHHARNNPEPMQVKDLQHVPKQVNVKEPQGMGQ